MIRSGTPVVRPGESAPWQVAWVQPDQPGAPDVFVGSIERERFSERTEPRRLKLVDGSWTDIGPADVPDASRWHPDLPEYLARIVTASQDACRAIPDCLKATLHLSYARFSYEDRFVSDATFEIASRDEPGRCAGVMIDADLDWFPQVRLVERAALDFQKFLGIVGYDDASGYEGEFSAEVSATSFVLQHEHDEHGTLVLASSFENGRWTHATTLTTRDEGSDAISAMRAARDRDAWLGGIVREGWKECYPAAAPNVVSCEPHEESPTKVVLRLAPGSLLARESVAQAA